MKNTEDTILLDTEGAARILCLSKSYLAKARMTGAPKIPYVKIGAAVRYRRSDLEAFAEQHVQKSTAERYRASN